MNQVSVANLATSSWAAVARRAPCGRAGSGFYLVGPSMLHVHKTKNGKHTPQSTRRVFESKSWPSLSISAHPGGWLQWMRCSDATRALCSCPNSDSSTGCDSKCSCEANLCTSWRLQWMRCSDAGGRSLCSCPKRDSSPGCDSKCSCVANLCTSWRLQWMRCSDAGAVRVLTVILLLGVIQSALA